jgi:hypothetical protein
MNYINLTPHAIKLNDGRIFETSGIIARVSTSYTDFVNDIATVTFGNVENLPEQKPDVLYIVSAMVKQAIGNKRNDLIVPATGHKDCKRNSDGQIISVPGFIR